MVRLLWFTPIAFILTLAVFALMASLTDSRKAEPHIIPGITLDVLALPPEPQPLRKQRVLPNPPLHLPEPSLALAVTIAPPKFDLRSQGLEVAPVLGIEMDPLQVMMPSLDIETEPVELVPVYRVDPDYPPKAVQRGIEGYVTLRFDIDQDGVPFDIEVLQAKPKRIFDRSAIRALKRWRYSPIVVDGKAVIQRGQTVKLAFELSQ
ncbi:TonB family protein [Vibrio sp. JPW-9-11-11]|uniref:energy transducer TonB n=1 Tax=Vibrio sp. JPW-9-11-11 TaxID=1416532 RepID=UPI00159323AC|nr:energy transducer TonB [Vibrio sp. JPW-9-11-11]NVD06734.1 TonB family protein [Vibrio sp. JPW-9-11-11]